MLIEQVMVILLEAVQAGVVKDSLYLGFFA